MKKIKQHFIVFLLIILAIAIVEITNYYLMPVPTVGPVTVSDEIGDTSHPELPFMNIVEGTVEKNETNLTVRIKVNGDIPNQTESSDERTVTYQYHFKTFIHLELEGNDWTPMVGHDAYKAGFMVDYAGEDFPGSFIIDQKNRSIRIIVDLNFLREKDVQTDVTSEAFKWSIGTFVENETRLSSRGFMADSVSSYFPDYDSFRRPVIHRLTLVAIAIGGIVYSLFVAYKVTHSCSKDYL